MQEEEYEEDESEEELENGAKDGAQNLFINNQYWRGFFEVRLDWCPPRPKF